MSSSDAKDGQIPESTSTPADPLEAGQSAALGKGHDLSAESRVARAVGGGDYCFEHDICTLDRPCLECAAKTSIKCRGCGKLMNPNSAFDICWHCDPNAKMVSRR